jgi:branched-chain amino acid transport system substrate-binding protein
MSGAARFTRLPVLALLLAITAAIGIACGSSDNNKATTPATPAASRAAATTTTAAASATTAAQATTAATAPAQTRAVNLGVVLSLNGAGGVYGKTQKNGIDLAVAEINDKNAVPGIKITVSYEDDNSDRNQGINAFNKLISANVHAIIGPTLSNTAQATDPVAQEAKVPVLGVSNTLAGLTDIGDYIFRDSLTEADVIPQAVKKVKDKLNPKKAALLFANDDAFSKAGGDVMRDALKANGIDVVTEQSFSTKDTDFRSILTNVKNANPDILFVSALNDPVVGIVTQARELGLKQTIVGGNGFNTPALAQQAGDAAEGIIVGAAWNAASPNAKSQDFIKNYKAKYNADPDQFAAQAYAGVYILATAVSKADTFDRKGIRDALPKIKDLDTVLGKFSFNDKRDAQHPAVIQIIKSGKFAIYE